MILNSNIDNISCDPLTMIKLHYYNLTKLLSRHNYDLVTRNKIVAVCSQDGIKLDINYTVIQSNTIYVFDSPHMFDCFYGELPSVMRLLSVWKSFFTDNLTPDALKHSHIENTHDAELAYQYIKSYTASMGLTFNHII